MSRRLQLSWVARRGIKPLPPFALALNAPPTSGLAYDAAYANVRAELPLWPRPPN